MSVPLINFLVLPVLSAACFILSFPNYNVNFLAWVFLVPVFIGLRQDPQVPLISQKRRRGIFGAYIAGVLSFLGVIYWLTNVTVGGYIAVCLYLGLYFWFFALIIEKFVRQGRTVIFWAPCVWVALEFVRSKLITGFPWALAGATQIAYLPLVQIAAVTGVWGVSFVVVLINAFVFENLYAGVIKKEGVKDYKATLLAIVVVSYVLFSGWQEMKPPKKAIERIPFRISVVQPDIDQEQKWDARFRNFIFGRFRYLTYELKRSGPDLIIWPESCMPGELRYDREIYDVVSGLVRFLDAPILLGSQDIEFGPERRYYNAALLIHPKYKFLGQYNKLHLVPFGEYVPLGSSVPFMKKLTPIEADFAPGNDYATFGIPQVTMLMQGDRGEIVSHTKIVRFGVVICFEDIFPDLVRRFAKHDLDFMVNITNDAWFKRTSAPFQHAYLSAFRAIENRIYLVRAANTGYSCVIDPYGRIIADVRDKNDETLFVPGHLTCEIASVRKKTLYNQFGDYFPIICCLISVLGLILVYKKK
jgi:apolipoprotein N-acyltransferase